MPRPLRPGPRSARSVTQKSLFNRRSLVLVPLPSILWARSRREAVGKIGKAAVSSARPQVVLGAPGCARARAKKRRRWAERLRRSTAQQALRLPEAMRSTQQRTARNLRTRNQSLLVLHARTPLWLSKELRRGRSPKESQ